ncbi:MAG: hypothetical protein CVV22_08930 [Ignavibacteriae bacterium HGW-Ignavibacteriae-1]|jgi:hypothetical protein|nr:MAG: hypothetical protein CVV22_08930 [Ignavibacteriae bacterium HGW-Ignavibacteriae-1]
MIDLHEYYDTANRHNVLLSFKGALSQEILVEMGNIVKNRVNLNKKLKKLFSIFVELSQNIMHYSSERVLIDGKEIGVGIILFTENDTNFTIYSGNMVDTQGVRFLTDKIDNLNAMNDDQLKDTYSTSLHADRPVESKGAGLGLIEIARKASGKISYNKHKKDAKNTFVTIKVQIDKE